MAQTARVVRNCLSLEQVAAELDIVDPEEAILGGVADGVAFQRRWLATTDHLMLTPGLGVRAVTTARPTRSPDGFLRESFTPHRMRKMHEYVVGEEIHRDNFARRVKPLLGIDLKGGKPVLSTATRGGPRDVVSVDRCLLAAAISK